MSRQQKNLDYMETKLIQARKGIGVTKEEAIKFLREVVVDTAEKAPEEDLIEIADFITGFLRRHIQKHTDSN